MVFEGRVDCTFGCIDSMFFGWNALKIDLVFCEGFFESLQAFIVQQNMKLRCWMTVVN